MLRKIVALVMLGLDQQRTTCRTFEGFVVCERGHGAEQCLPPVGDSLSSLGLETVRSIPKSKRGQTSSLSTTHSTALVTPLKERRKACFLKCE